MKAWINKANRPGRHGNEIGSIDTVCRISKPQSGVQWAVSSKHAAPTGLDWLWGLARQIWRAYGAAESHLRFFNWLNELPEAVLIWTISWPLVSVIL